MSSVQKWIGVNYKRGKLTFNIAKYDSPSVNSMVVTLLKCFKPGHRVVCRILREVTICETEKKGKDTF
jgi:hypothetical protein